MQEGEGDDGVAAEGVADSDKRARHLPPQSVDDAQQVARVVVPGWVVAERGFVDQTGLALPGGVGDEDGADFDAAGGEGEDQVFPEGLVEFL